MKLIEAYKALKIAESYGTTHGTSLGRHSGIADTIYDEIAKLPTIEVDPVRHGEWIAIGEQSAICSRCKSSLKSNGKDTTGKALIHKAVYHYCPNCGAKMDVGVKTDYERM